MTASMSYDVTRTVRGSSGSCVFLKIAQVITRGTNKMVAGSSSKYEHQVKSMSSKIILLQGSGGDASLPDWFYADIDRYLEKSPQRVLPQRAIFVRRVGRYRATIGRLQPLTAKYTIYCEVSRCSGL
jgi:hypothetical protein